MFIHICIYISPTYMCKRTIIYTYTWAYDVNEVQRKERKTGGKKTKRKSEYRGREVQRSGAVFWVLVHTPRVMYTQLDECRVMYTL